MSCDVQTVTVLLLSQFVFLFFFPPLINVARTSKTMLNKSGEGGHPRLVLDLIESALSFSQLSMMLAMGLS